MTTTKLMLFFIAVCFFGGWLFAFFIGLCITTSIGKLLIWGLIIFMLLGNLIVFIGAYRNYKREQKCQDTQM